MYQIIKITKIDKPYAAGEPEPIEAATHMELMRKLHDQSSHYAQATDALDGLIDGLPAGAKVYAMTNEHHGEVHNYVAILEA